MPPRPQLNSNLFLTNSILTVRGSPENSTGIPINCFAGESIKAPPDDVYQAALEVAIDMEALAAQSNDKLRYFKTDPLKMKLTMEECDCDSMLGIPYLKDKSL